MTEEWDWDRKAHLTVFFTVLVLCVAFMIFMLTTVIIFANSNDDTPDRQAGITISNSVGYNVTVDMWVLGTDDWDRIYVSTVSGSDKSMDISWHGPEEITVLVVYEGEDGQNVFDYVIRDGEWTTVLLI